MAEGHGDYAPHNSHRSMMNRRMANHRRVERLKLERRLKREGNAKLPTARNKN